MSGSIWLTNPHFPNRAAPDVPNVVTGNVTPLRPETSLPVKKVQLSIRLDSSALENLDELEARLENYRQRQKVTKILWKAKFVRRLSLDAATHAYIRAEAATNGMTINSFVTKLLTDARLEVSNEPKSSPPPDDDPDDDSDELTNVSDTQ